MTFDDTGWHLNEERGYYERQVGDFLTAVLAHPKNGRWGMFGRDTTEPRYFNIPQSFHATEAEARAAGDAWLKQEITDQASWRTGRFADELDITFAPSA